MSELFYISISNQIESKIRSGEIKENEKLPSERQLASDYGVSRAVIREALRVLDEKGLIKVVVGKGNYVSLPKDEYLTNKFEDVIDYHNINKNDVMQARQVIEVAVGTLILDALSPEDVEAFETIYTQMEQTIMDVHAFSMLDAKFHMQIARCTGNRLIEIIANILNNVTDRKLLFEDEIEIRRNAQREHHKIIEAFKLRDKAMLETAIASHMHSYGKHIRM